VRVEEKLADPSARVVVVCDGEELVGMALAEPSKHDGTGAIITGVGHVSMVFVAPTRWGLGIGGRLVEALHTEMRDANWHKASLWTRASNDRARRLYERSGYTTTGDAKHLESGDEIVRYQALLS
jgi:ribosomal protein S18 acetylase RimI-like enzyme